MDRRWLWCGLVCQVLMLAGVAVAADPLTVTDVDSLVITGNQKFTAEQIRQELAVHPQAIEAFTRSPAQWLQLVPELVASGYQSFGYLDVTATMNGAGQLTIVEGPHYDIGEIRVNGAPDSLAEVIRTELSEPVPKPAANSTNPPEPPGVKVKVDVKKSKQEKASWKPGESANVSEKLRRHFEKQAQQGLELDGRSGGELTVRFEPEVSTKLVHLIVDVADAGHLTEVADFEVEGLTRHTAEEVIEYLGLKPGPFSLADRQAVVSKLRESGRFLGHRADLIAPFRRGDPYRMLIHVKECPGSPKLNEPFTPEQEVLLKCRQWMENFGTNGHQLVISMKGNPVPEYIKIWPDGEFDLEIVVSPTHQTGFRIESRRQHDGKLRGYLMGVGDTWFSLCSHQTGRQFSLQRKDETLFIVTCEMHGVDERFKPVNTGVEFGYGFSTGKKNRESPLKVDVAPAFLLYVPQEYTAVSRIEGTQLHQKSKMANTWIDVETGRPQLVEIRDPAYPEIPVIRFSTDPDNFQAKWDSWQPPEKFQNVGTPDTPITSLAEFIVSEWDKFDTEGIVARRAIMKLIRPDILAAADRSMIAPAKDDEDSEFYIPSDSAGIKAYIVSFFLQFDRHLLRQNSTAAEVAHSLILTTLHETKENMQRILTAAAKPDCGPLSCALFGTGALGVKPQIGTLFGQVGLTRLSEESFAADLDQWFEERQIIGRAAIQIVRRMQELTDEEAAALVALCHDPAAARLLDEVIAELRAPLPAMPEEDANTRELARFRAALTRLWTPVLRPHVERYLKRLAGSPKPLSL